MNIRSWAFGAAALFFLSSSESWAVNKYNFKCPAAAAIAALAPAPTGWTIGAGVELPVQNAYMAQPTLMGCTYSNINVVVGNLYKAMPSGVTCTVAGDGQTFNCSGGTTVSCPAQAVVGFMSPTPVGWSAGSPNWGPVAGNYTFAGGNGVSCNYKGFGGPIFQSTPPGATCTRAADGKSFDCTSPFVTSTGAAVADILPVLDSPTMSWLSSKIVFTNGNGSAYPYSAWSTADRNRLKQLYQNMLSGAPLGVSCPNLSTQIVGRKLYSYRAQALDVYMAQVAHAFYVEAAQLVPWSFLGFSSQMLSEFLGSKSLFSTIQPSAAVGAYPTGIMVGTDFQSPSRTDSEGAPSIVCNPHIGYRLAAGLSTYYGQYLIGPDRESTLMALSVWFAENVGHGGTPTNPVTASKIEDRLVIRDAGRGVMASNGCHGASNLFYDIARSINLPIVQARMVDQKLSYPVPPTMSPTPGFFQFTHGALVFAWGEPGERVIQHMDDMYAMGNRTWGPIGANGAQLPYDQAAWTFFNTVWRTPANLVARGFAYESALPWVIPGTGWGLYQRGGGYEDRPDFGRLLGVWNPEGTDEWRLRNAYVYDQGYDLCRWQNYLNFYCQSPVGTNSDWTRFVTPPATGPYRTLSDHTSHAAACIAAAGSCSAAQSAANDFYSSIWGLDTVDSP